jgi:hypothetical protein
MATYTVPSGTFSYTNTLTANTADTVTFSDRANFVSVTNTGSTVLYARSDGTVATVGGEGCIAVLPNSTAVLANSGPYWNQASKVIAQGTNENALGPVSSSNPSTPTAPGFVTSQESLRGQMANSGTVVSIISSAADTYTLALTG